MTTSLAAPSSRATDLHARMVDFLRDQVLPAEAEYEQARRDAGPHGHDVPPVIERLKTEAKAQGLWNLFLPSESGLTQLEYARWRADRLEPGPLPRGHQLRGPRHRQHGAAAPAGHPEQKQQWLEPLLAGEIRSAFAMTEPAVASSDATNIETRIERDGGDYVINGRKWWTSGVLDPRCAVLIVMGKTDPAAPKHRQQSMVVVPRDTPGVVVERDLPVFGQHDQHGHGVVRFDDVRVPVSSVVGEEGGGFAAAQARLGPGRIHHCMRALGAAERALAMMVARCRSGWRSAGRWPSRAWCSTRSPRAASSWTRPG